MSEEQAVAEDTAESLPVTPSASVFIDESYSDRDYYVAALLMTTGQIADLESRFQEIRRFARFKWSVPDNIEFHAHDIMQGRGPWTVLLGRVGDAASLYRRLLKAVVNAEVSVAVQAVDVIRMTRRFEYPATPYEVTARRALEQVDQWCGDLGINAAQVIADEIGPDEKPSASAFTRIIEGTTLGASSSHPGPLHHMLGPVRLVNSAEDSGVQAADLVAHIVRRHLEETAAASPAARLARGLYHTILPAVKYSAKWRP
jgi:hypothetical protein